jgi:hypothetical protein
MIGGILKYAYVLASYKQNFELDGVETLSQQLNFFNLKRDGRQ